MSKEIRKQINKIKNLSLLNEKLLNENIENTNGITVLIRSKIDKNFRLDISYDMEKNGIIFKVETQGDFEEKMNNKDFLNLIISGK